MKFIQGKVIKGDKKAARTGFPTANLSEKVIEKYRVKNGVFAAWVYLKNKRCKAALICGTRDRQKRKKIEIFLINHKKNLYGQIIKVQIVKKIRNLAIFKSVRELRIQAVKDIKRIKKILNSKNAD